MKTSLRQLRYFAAVARTGSATRAAALLNVSQPSVSAAVRDLEETLGQPLFLRRPAQGLTLTPFGAEKARAAHDILSRVEALAETPDAPPRQRLQLGYFATLGPTWIPAIARHLATALPALDLGLHECDLDRIARDLASGVIDCAISYDIGLPPGTPRRVLAEVAAQALVPPDHPLATRARVDLAALATCDFILIDLPISREFLMVPFWQRGLSPRIRLRTASIDMARQMVAAGLGVSLLYTPPGPAAVGGAVLRPLADPLPVQRLVLAHEERRAADPLIAATAGAIAACFPGATG